jgi:hypothetical protein
MRFFYKTDLKGWLLYFIFSEDQPIIAYAANVLARNRMKEIRKNWFYIFFFDFFKKFGIGFSVPKTNRGWVLSDWRWLSTS